MKARLLKKLLNNTGYTVAFYDKYIGIGSPLCHDLIKVTIPDFNITYALDSYNRKGQNGVAHHEELYFIWGKLQELIDSGEMNDIMSGDDELENPLPAYTVRWDGKFFATQTDAYGWPNVTKEGYMMHDNDYFDNPIDALKYGIKEIKYNVEACESSLNELNLKVFEKKNRIKEIQDNIVQLNSLLAQYSNQ